MPVENKDVQGWFFSLPTGIIALVLIIAALCFFGYKFLTKERQYYQRLIESDREYFRSIIESKDEHIKVLVEKLMLIYQAAIETETTLIREIRDMQDILREKLKSKTHCKNSGWISTLNP